MTNEITIDVITINRAIETLIVHLAENPESLVKVWELCIGNKLVLIDRGVN
jgi:hypothetical protein